MVKELSNKAVADSMKERDEDDLAEQIAELLLKVTVRHSIEDDEFDEIADVYFIESIPSHLWMKSDINSVFNPVAASKVWYAPETEYSKGNNGGRYACELATWFPPCQRTSESIPAKPCDHILIAYGMRSLKWTSITSKDHADALLGKGKLSKSKEGGE